MLWLGQELLTYIAEQKKAGQSKSIPDRVSDMSSLNQIPNELIISIQRELLEDTCSKIRESSI